MKALENSMNFRCPENLRFSRILEVGCGSGAFTTLVARDVGKEGELFALDIQPEMLEQIEKKLSAPENKVCKNYVFATSKSKILTDIKNIKSEANGEGKVKIRKIPLIKLFFSIKDLMDEQHSLLQIYINNHGSP